MLARLIIFIVLSEAIKPALNIRLTCHVFALSELTVLRVKATATIRSIKSDH
jgi:hypothetical protein